MFVLKVCIKLNSIHLYYIYSNYKQPANKMYSTYIKLRLLKCIYNVYDMHIHILLLLFNIYYFSLHENISYISIRSDYKSSLVFCCFEQPYIRVHLKYLLVWGFNEVGILYFNLRLKKPKSHVQL